MIDHIFPSAAINLAATTAVKYQLSDDSTPDVHVQQVMDQISPVLENEAVRPVEYLKTVRSRAVLEVATNATDALTQRRKDFMAALVRVIDAKIATMPEN